MEDDPSRRMAPSRKRADARAFGVGTYFFLQSLLAEQLGGRLQPCTDRCNSGRGFQGRVTCKVQGPLAKRLGASKPWGSCPHSSAGVKRLQIVTCEVTRCSTMTPSNTTYRVCWAQDGLQNRPCWVRFLDSVPMACRSTGRTRSCYLRNLGSNPSGPARNAADKA